MEFCSIERGDAVTMSSLMCVYEETMARTLQNGKTESTVPEARKKEALEREFAEFIANFTAQDDRHLFALRDGERLAAALRVIEMAQGGWYLEALETAPEYRGRGCARRLLLETLHCLKALSAHTVVSVVRRDNAASRVVHEACGFVDTGQVARDMEGTPLEDCMIYRCDCTE